MKMKYILFFILFINFLFADKDTIYIPPIYEETAGNKLKAIDTLIDDSKFNFVLNLDNVHLLEEKYIKKYFEQRDAVIKIEYNERIKELINFYLIKHPNTTGKMFLNAYTYFPEYTELLKKFYIPYEINVLPFVLSGYNKFYTENRLSGIWQLDRANSQIYGLKIDSLNDERFDPASSTTAAAGRIYNLYNIYREFKLVILAYGNGSAKVNAALKRAESTGKPIEEFLYSDRKDYFNAFAALTYINKHFHKFYTYKANLEMIKTDTIIINQKVHLGQIAEVLDLNIKILEGLNPKYYKNIIPEDSIGRGIILPKEYSEKYLEMEDSIYACRDSFYFKIKPKKKIKEETNTISKNKVAVYYKVKSGDNLGFIADWFDVWISDLKRWNNLRSSRIRAGQNLIVYVPQSKSSYYKRINFMTFNEKQGGKKIHTQKTEVKGEFIYYTVQSGDTAWSIAQQFPGVSDKDIIKWNNINPKNIRPGQKLKVKKLN